MPRSRRALLGVLVAVFLAAPYGGTVVFGRAAGDSSLMVADAFEPDNTAGTGSLLISTVPQAHTFHSGSDQDWAKIAVVPGQQSFILETSNLQFDADTFLQLLDQDGATVLASNDDNGDDDSVASRIIYTYTSANAGFLYVRVTDVVATVDGAYSLTLNPGDAFEVDGTPAQAKLISPGLRQSHTFSSDGDEDWAKLNVVSGRKYTITTSGLTTGVDTIMELYAADGITKLDENDDAAEDILGSRISYRVEATGVFYVKVMQYGGVGRGAYTLTLERAPGVYINSDNNADVFTFSPSTGTWARQVSNGAGGFVATLGAWTTGWQVLPASFNSDALTDFFLFHTTTGQWFRMVNDGAGGFTVQATDGWWPGWERYALDLNGDGITDFFLYDPNTGTWFKAVTTADGFTYEQGGWSPGWEIYPMKFNLDEYGDLFLIHRTTGRWFWVTGGPTSFSYPVTETWFAGWVLYPGDFNGDGLSDLLLQDPNTGTYFVATTAASGFTYVQGGWSLGWTPYVADLNGDGSDDLFLHAAATGKWFHMISDNAGHFTNAGGETWSQGWQVRVGDFNGDRRDDILLYHPTSGVWYQALNNGAGGFTYGSGTWASNLQVVVRPPIR